MGSGDIGAGGMAFGTPCAVSGGSALETMMTSRRFGGRYAASAISLPVRRRASASISAT